MATKATLGFGTFLKRGDGAAPENFSVVSEILDIKGPAHKRDMKDTTNMSSPSGVKENIAGLLDSGTVQVDINWVPGDGVHAGILSDLQSGVLRNWQIALPAAIGKTWSFAAFVSDFAPAYPVDDKIKTTITLDITGPATLA